MRLAGLESKIRKPKVTRLEKDVTRSMVRVVFMADSTSFGASSATFLTSDGDPLFSFQYFSLP